jgi:hypothetical protein
VKAVSPVYIFFAIICHNDYAEPRIKEVSRVLWEDYSNAIQIKFILIHIASLTLGLQVADEGDGLYLWVIVADILNKQL